MKYGFQEYKEKEVLRNHLNLGGDNPGGERIDVNSRYFEKGGKPWIGVMGEYHFVRDSQENWLEELCKMKAGGITVVATYMFWIYHEEIEGEYDFAEDRDVRKFILAAREAGLDVLLRIGPWAHGECRNGGFPDWLLQKPYKLREDNPEYLAVVRTWYQKIYEHVRGLFYQDGGNIIGIQIENEFVDNAEHLLTLKKLAKEIGLLAPVYTVTGWNSKYGAKIPVDDVVPVFGGYCEAPWTGHIRQLPPSIHYVFQSMRNDSAIGEDLIGGTREEDWQLPYERYPYATCELGGGIQVTHHRRPIISAMDTYALSLTKLGSGNNLVGYYMYHGGTNKIGKLSTLNETRATGYPNDYSILSYDFQAPISEYGEIREQYGLLNIMHLFVNDFGEILAPMELVEASGWIVENEENALEESDEFAGKHSQYPVSANDCATLRYAMRTNGESGFVFVNHYQRLAELADVKDVEIVAQGVHFPTMDVCGEISFFLPFRMNLSGNLLEYATAQPLCRVDHTYFFLAVEGITPQFRFADGQEFITEIGCDKVLQVNDIQIVTLTLEEAHYVRKLSGKLYLGTQCNLFCMNGKICAVGERAFTYRCWNGSQWDCFRVDAAGEIRVSAEMLWSSELQAEEQEKAALKFTIEDVEKQPFMPAYLEELQFGGERKLTWKKISVSDAEGFVEIPYVCDVEQIYADGRLVADNFYYGRPWRVPAKLLYGREVYLVMSEMREDFYKEF